MKKNLFMPFMIVSLALVACGKGDSNSSSGSGGVINDGGGPIINPPIDPGPIPPTSSGFAQNCQANGGTIVNGSGEQLCMYQGNYLRYPSGSQFYCNLGASQVGWNSGVFVYPNDTVILTATGNPDIVINGRTFSYSSSFIPNASGTLSFTSRSCTKKFQVTGIFIKRCINEGGYGKLCP